MNSYRVELVLDIRAYDAERAVYEAMQILFSGSPATTVDVYNAEGQVVGVYNVATGQEEYSAE